MRKEYDLSGAKPGNYWKRIGPAGREVLIKQFLGVAHLVRLADDVAAAFPDEDAVNQALRLLLQMRALDTAPKATPRSRKPTAKGRKPKAA